MAVAPGSSRWVRNTTLFLAGQTVSLLGSSLVQYAILWHLTLQTRSGVVLTVSTVAGFLPQAIMSIFGGVWADRYNRKMLLITADVTIALATLVLAVLLISGYDGLWPVFAILAIRSLGAGVQMPAVGAMLPQIVPTEHLARVNGINTSIQSGLTLLSPALAAALYASVGLQLVLLVDVVTAIIAVGLLTLIPVATIRSETARSGYFGDAIGGLNYVRRSPVLLRVLVFSAIIMMLAAPPSMLTPLLVVRTFGEEVWKLTANELAFGIGMLSGGAFIAWTGQRHDRIRMLMSSSLGFAATSIGMGLAGASFGRTGNLWVFLAFMLLCGVSVAYFVTTTTTVLQEHSDPVMMGRVFGVSGIVSALAMPFGMLVIGPLADVVSVESILLATGLVSIVVTAVAGVGAPRAPAPVAEDRMPTPDEPR